MKIKMRPIASITPYENNPRKNEKAVAAVARSITEFGWQQPIVVDDADVIIIGHTRYKAALRLGFEKVPVHVASGLDPEKVKALRIADNASGEIAEWDLDRLRIEVEELRTLDVSDTLLCLPPARLVKISFPAGSDDEDVPPKDPNILVRLSFHPEVWLGGRDKIMTVLEKLKSRFLCRVNVDE